MDERPELETAGIGILQLRDRPAGEDARQRLDIGLAVAAIDAKRVAVPESRGRDSLLMPLPRRIPAMESGPTDWALSR